MRSGTEHMQTGRVKLKAKWGEQLAASSCCDLSALTGAEWSKHASPVSPWSVSMETPFLTPTHVQYFCLPCFTFPDASMRLR